MPRRTLLIALGCASLGLERAHALEHSAQHILNPTGRALNMPVPLRVGESVVGDVVVTIDQHEQVLVAATDIAPHLQSILADSAHITLGAYGAAPIPVGVFSEIEGLQVDFDHLAMELKVKLATGKTKPQTLSFTRERAAPTLNPPASVSAFLNYTLTLSQDWQHEDASGFTLDLEGAARVGGVVFEAEASAGGALNGFLCPIEAACRDQSENTFRRRGTRAVYDIPDWDTRTVLGDTSYPGLPSQRSFDLLGLTLQHDPQVFGKRRHQTTRAFNQMLVIDRAANLELVINGIPMQRLKLQPGTYSLTDLPVTLGANAIEAIVTYDTGEREVFAFSTLANQQLLDAGATAWSVSGGLPATWVDGEREYLGTFQGGGYIRHGMSDTLTAYVTAQTDSTIHNAGFGFHHLSALGTLHLGATFSHGPGVGYAATASFETLPDSDIPRRSLRLAADYYSPDFRHPGDAQLLESDILYPAFDAWLRLTAVASHPLPWDAYATLTARYDFAADRPNIPGAVSVGTDRWSVDAGLSREFFDTATLSFTAGYGNDRLLSFSDLEEEPEFRFGVALYARFGHTSVSARHSFGNDVSSVAASHIVHTPANTWQANINTEDSPERGLHTTASASQSGAWGETRITHTAQQPRHGEASQRTQLQHGGALAFADGKLALGPPVRDAFAIVYPHPTIADSRVIVGNPDDPRASGSSWWPALIADLPAYGTVQYALDATDIPAGYSLGAAQLNVRSPYRAGYAVALGSDTPLTAFGTLLDREGKPATLKSGIATSPAHPAHTVQVFTNAAGRFAAEGLAPGAWRISLQDADTYSFTIPESATGLHDAASLMPDGADHPATPAPPSDHWPATLISEAQ